MEYFLGLLTAVVFFVAIIAAYLFGARKGMKTTIPSDLEEVRKAKEHQANFLKLMNYDVDKALQRKKVT